MDVLTTLLLDVLIICVFAGILCVVLWRKRRRRTQPKAEKTDDAESISDEEMAKALLRVFDRLDELESKVNELEKKVGERKKKV